MPTTTTTEPTDVPAEPPPPSTAPFDTCLICATDLTDEDEATDDERQHGVCASCLEAAYDEQANVWDLTFDWSGSRNRSHEQDAGIDFEGGRLDDLVRILMGDAVRGFSYGYTYRLAFNDDSTAVDIEVIGGDTRLDDHPRRAGIRAVPADPAPVTPAPRTRFHITISETDLWNDHPIVLDWTDTNDMHVHHRGETSDSITCYEIDVDDSVMDGLIDILNTEGLSYTTELISWP